MRPTIEEQLKGICRVLGTTIAPLLTEAYPEHVLRGLISNLSMLADAIPKIQGFLAWDSAGVRSILADIGPGLDAPLRGEVEATLASSAPDALDWQAADANNEVLRDLLSRAIRNDGLDEAHVEGIIRHLAERAAKNPIRFAIVTPKSGNDKKD